MGYLIGCSSTTNKPYTKSNLEDLNAAIHAIQNQDPKKLRLIISKNKAILNNVEDSNGNTRLNVAANIGNNAYQYLPPLKTARNDAEKVADILSKKYGFEVTLLLDADRSDILLALNSLRWNLSNRDNLLIYYAGHGWLDEEADEGYWLPVNARKDNTLAWISNSSITANLRALKVKHVLIVADSCYSGKLARGVHIINKTPGYLSRLSRKRARCVISSGGLEPVIDSGGDGLHSVFATAFLNALQENKDILDGAQLFNMLCCPVMLNSDQTPEYSDIRKAGHEGGAFLFVPLGQYSKTLLFIENTGNSPCISKCLIFLWEWAGILLWRYWMLPKNYSSRKKMCCFGKAIQPGIFMFF